MVKKGLINGGFYDDKLSFGGIEPPSGRGTFDVGPFDGVRNIPSLVSAYSSGTHQDLVVRNLIIAPINYPAIYSPTYGLSGSGNVGTYRTIVKDTCRIDTNCGITMDASYASGTLGSTWTTAAQCYGYNDGSVGGSGAGGLPGSSGQPTSVIGSFGYGGGNGGNGTFSGGASGFPLYANPFQSSIWQTGTVFLPDFLGGNPVGGSSTDDPQKRYSYVLRGGCGGGGSATACGGSGGGVLFLVANTLILNGGFISANGQNTTPGGSGAGGGGLIIIVVSDLQWPNNSSYISVNSGTGGNPTPTAGRILIFSNQFVGAFSNTIYRSDYLAALNQYQSL